MRAGRAFIRRLADVVITKPLDGEVQAAPKLEELLA